MSIALASQYTQRNYRWTDWKVIKTAKSLVYQYDDDGTIYTIYGYDGPEVHVCQIFKSTVPYAIVDGGYSQSQNDSDKTDFETNFLSNANAPLNTTHLTGYTDGVKIGNVGDRLKVDSNNNSIGSGTHTSWSKKLRYEDMNDNTGGLARNTSVSPSSWTQTYSYSGSGSLVGFMMNLESQDDWFIRLLIDGTEEIFGSNGIKSDDLDEEGVYDMDPSGKSLEESKLGVFLGQHNVFQFMSPMSLPIKFSSEIKIYIKRDTGKQAKKFKAGLIVLQKDT